jgi:cell shape-determining protein MreC
MGMAAVAQTLQNLQSAAKQDKLALSRASKKHDEDQRALEEQNLELNKAHSGLKPLHRENARLKKDLVIEKRKTDPHNLPHRVQLPNPLPYRTKSSRKAQEMQ